MADNRSYCRAIRNYLQINIVSSEEIAGNTDSKDKDAPTQDSVSGNSGITDLTKVAEKKIRESGFKTFKEFNKALVDKGITDFSQYEKFKDIPKERLFELLEDINKVNDKK